MGNNEVAIEITGLRVVRGGTAVIESLDLTVPVGQVVGLLGPSGSGKTTLMRAIVGAQIVAGGTVTVLGSPAGSAALRRRIGYVTQAPSVYADLLVLDEPTVGLDPVLRRALWELFHRLSGSGVSLLVSSHVMDEAARCDRLILLRGGSVLADGTLDELLAG